jgi:hypothetical protein
MNPELGTRLLIVVDAAIADLSELPPRARALIDGASEVYVVAPTLPGRLDWLAWELNPSRHAADQRLGAVLDQMRSIGAPARGAIGDDSILTAFEDAVAAFLPDHILVVVHDAAHANWQERGLAEHVEAAFDLPLTTVALDGQGHVSGTARPEPASA